MERINKIKVTLKLILIFLIITAFIGLIFVISPATIAGQ